MIGGIPGINLIGYAEPFAGDGLPALQARLAFTYQMIVASDGAVVFTDESQRVRPIAPGADGVVNGGPDEVVRTIAGFFGPVPTAPTGFATSYSAISAASSRIRWRRARSSSRPASATSCCSSGSPRQVSSRRLRRTRQSSTSPRR